MDVWDEAAIERRLAELAPVEPDEPPPRRAAVAVVLALRAVPRALLMRRSEHPTDPWSGQVSLPGGGLDPGDADLVAAARRETLEEVGVDLAADARLLGRLAPRRARARGRVLDMDVTPIVFALERAVTPVLNEEAEEAFWLPLERAAAGELDDVYRYERPDGDRARLPAWRFEGRVVWGMTHRILSDLIEAVAPAGAG